jgi:hypothetical protein
METVVTSYEVLANQPRPRLVELIGRESLSQFLKEATAEFTLESSRRTNVSLLVSVMYRGPRHSLELEAWVTAMRGYSLKTVGESKPVTGLPDRVVDWEVVPFQSEVMTPQYDYYATRYVRDSGSEHARLTANMLLFYGANHLLRALISPKATFTLAFACSPVRVLPIF